LVLLLERHFLVMLEVLLLKLLPLMLLRQPKPTSLLELTVILRLVHALQP